MKPERVSFLSYPGVFRVRDVCCENIECPCTSIWFHLTEVRARNRIVKPPIRISIKVDALTWQELDAPQRSPEFDEVVAEFLRDYPEVERDVLKEWFLERQSIVAKLRECVVDPDDVESGILFDFFEILGVSGEYLSLGGYIVEYSGMEYSVRERFCLPVWEREEVQEMLRTLRRRGFVGFAARCPRSTRMAWWRAGCASGVSSAIPSQQRSRNNSLAPVLQGEGWGEERNRRMGKRFRERCLNRIPASPPVSCFRRTLAFPPLISSVVIPVSHRTNARACGKPAA